MDYVFYIAEVTNLFKWNFRDLTNKQLDYLSKYLGEKYPNYKKIYCGEKGHSRDEYVCPKTHKFGVRLSGKEGCSYCKHCAAIAEMQRKNRKSDKTLRSEVRARRSQL